MFVVLGRLVQELAFQLFPLCNRTAEKITNKARAEVALRRRVVVFLVAVLHLSVLSPALVGRVMRSWVAYDWWPWPWARPTVTVMRLLFTVAPVVLARICDCRPHLAAKFVQHRKNQVEQSFELLVLPQKAAIWLLAIVRVDLHLQQKVGRVGPTVVARLMGVAVLVVMALAVAGRKYVASVCVLMVVVPLPHVAASDARPFGEDYAVAAGEVWFRQTVDEVIAKVL